MYKHQSLQEFGRAYFHKGLIDKYEIILYAKSLHDSPAWIKANWRRKIKLASKNHDKFIAKLELENRIYNNIDVFNLKVALLFPLRIINESYLSPIDQILNHNISNRLGNFLSRIARNKGRFINTADFYYLNLYGIPFNAIPLCQYNLYNQNRVQRYKYWQVGVEIHRALKKATKPPA